MNDQQHPPASTAAGQRTHLVWSHEHDAWWRPESKGYTTDILQAGLYTQAEAGDIAGNDHGNWRKNEEAVDAATALRSAAKVVKVEANRMFERAGRMAAIAARIERDGITEAVMP